MNILRQIHRLRRRSDPLSVRRAQNLDKSQKLVVAKPTMEKQRIIWSRVAHQPLHRPRLTRECTEGAPLYPKAYHIYIYILLHTPV